ncbi:hypothetical protein ACTWJ9_33115 (plasmid) [Streptomyces sp. GDS52]|uniref:hypothetical protein n=1 Tax=Streptomyces sp. GDS52 TaxID=3406419 RepID=UPI003FD5D7A3
MTVTKNTDGSHSPAYNENWPHPTQLEWHAGIVALETGLRIEVRKSSDIRTGIQPATEKPTEETYHLRLHGPRTSTGIGPMSFHDAWNYLDGVKAGVAAAQP